MQHPVTASALGATYLVGKIFYFRGYSTGVPGKRNSPLSAISYIGLFGLAGTCFKLGAAAIKALAK